MEYLLYTFSRNLFWNFRNNLRYHWYFWYSGTLGFPHKIVLLPGHREKRKLCQTQNQTNVSSHMCSEKWQFQLFSKKKNQKKSCFLIKHRRETLKFLQKCFSNKCLKSYYFTKSRPCHGCCPENFAKFSKQCFYRALYPQNICEQLLQFSFFLRVLGPWFKVKRINS